MEKFSGSRVNTMLSEQYEIWHVEDKITNEKDIYHYHDHYELHVTLSGEAEFFIEGEVYTLTPGTILLIHSNDLHRIMKQNSDNFERVYIFLTSEFLQKHSTPESDLELAFSSWDKNNHKSKVIKIPLNTLITNLDFILNYNKYDVKQFGSDIEYENRLVTFLVYVNRWLHDFDIVEEVNGKSDPIMNDMLTYVSENLKNELNLETMENRFFLSKFHIIRAFKKHTGMSFYQYVLKKRLLLSKKLLIKHKSVVDIYMECGFLTYTNYLRAFKKEFGITPKEFLKLTEENDKIINKR